MGFFRYIILNALHKGDNKDDDDNDDNDNNNNNNNRNNNSDKPENEFSLSSVRN